MGKTAQARAIGRQVSARLGWVVVFHRCRPKERARREVANQALAAMQRVWAPASTRPAVALRPVNAAGRPWPQPRPGHPAGRDLAPLSQLHRLLATGGEPTWAELEEFFALAGSFAQRMSRGVMVVLDDADRLDGPELECTGHLARSLSRHGLPVAFLLTGGARLGQRFARTANFARSVWPSRLDRFDDSEAREALVVPAADRGVEFADDALDLLCRAAAGRPLEVQRLGLAAWPAGAQPSGRVGLGAAEVAVARLVPRATARAS